MSGLDAGTLERKEQLLEASFGAMGSRARKRLSRRDVPRSRRPKVATSQGRDVPTSRRPNVATSQRRDALTSRRWVNNAEVNMWERRDVPTSRRQLEICTSSFKVQMAQKLGYREAYERGHGIPEQSDIDFEEVPRICTVFHFWIFLDIRMMFLILNIFIFPPSMF